MAKIAAVSEEVRPGIHPPTARLIASGEGWTVSDVVCTAGPLDRPFEERHTRVSIGVVVSGTFQYHSPTGRELMTPGALLLGNAGEFFTCGHDHGTGDHCLSFSYAPEHFDRLAHDASGRGGPFRVPRIPPVRPSARLVAAASALLAGNRRISPRELGLQIAARAVELEKGIAPRRAETDAASLRRVTQVVRWIENENGVPEDLDSLAQVARLSPYHFLRTFRFITGTTPHQYVLRVRLRRAAVRLRTESSKIVDIALDSGFGDISNFNRTFRAEFGMSPREYRSPSRCSLRD